MQFSRLARRAHDTFCRHGKHITRVDQGLIHIEDAALCVEALHIVAFELSPGLQYVVYAVTGLAVFHRVDESGHSTTGSQRLPTYQNNQHLLVTQGF